MTTAVTTETTILPAKTAPASLEHGAIGTCHDDRQHSCGQRDECGGTHVVLGERRKECKVQ